MAFPILSLLIIVPTLGFIVTLVAAKGMKSARWIALGFSLAQLVLTLLLVADFLTGGAVFRAEPASICLDPHTAIAQCFSPEDASQGLGFQHVERYPWVPTLGMNYQLGVDGLSLPLVFLTPLLVTLSIIYQWNEEHRPKEFYALLLLLGATVMGVFLALDFFLFAVFWELVLIPMFLLIGIWGGPRRRYAAIKFLIFTHVGFAIMLLSVFAIYLNVSPSLQSSLYEQLGGAAGTSFKPTFDMIVILRAMSDPVARGTFAVALQIPVFIAFFFGFGVKLPMVPFHTWLPDAHVEAPTAGSVILAGLLLKMGGYGLFRIAIGMMPQGSRELWWVLAIFGGVSMVYASFVCLPQIDMKRLIAYSSVGHMGFVLLGAASFNSIGIQGGIFQLFTHGLITAVLFMLAGSAKHGTGTRDIPELRGLAAKMPMFSLVLIIAAFASLGLPGMAGFVSEFMAFVGFYGGPVGLPEASIAPWRALILLPLLAVVITGAYYLWMLHRILFGTFNEALGKVHDLPRNELLAYAVLCGMIIWVGIYPSPFLGMIEAPGMALAGVR